MYVRWLACLLQVPVRSGRNSLDLESGDLALVPVTSCVTLDTSLYLSFLHLKYGIITPAYFMGPNGMFMKAVYKP